MAEQKRYGPAPGEAAWERAPHAKCRLCREGVSRDNELHEIGGRLFRHVCGTFEVHAQVREIPTPSSVEER